MIVITSVLAVAVVGSVWYARYKPFGGKSKPEQWKQSKNFNGKIFINQTTTSAGFSARETISLLRDMYDSKSRQLRQPDQPIEPQKVDIATFLAATDSTPLFIWLGHSTILLRINGKTILTDPILSMRSSPFSFAGPKRVISKVPITADALPPIDAVLLSHDHYDHLDYETISKLHAKTTKFFVPLGVAAHLRKWGVASTKIVELDWWDEIDFEGIKFACTPSRHFSGRKLGDRFVTLWCSWVIQTSQHKIFFSGDTAYGPHFKEIGKKFGSFDLTLLECGQYDQRWADVHMLPEETVQAHQDLGGKHLFLIHWGAFVLALHPWFDPGKRAEAAAAKAGIDLLSVKLGAIAGITEPAPKPWWDDIA